MADSDDDEARAERAREFRTNLDGQKKKKTSRKRYSIATPYIGHGQGRLDLGNGKFFARS